jgi:DNA-binding MarR family transcriptional regulator
MSTQFTNESAGAGPEIPLGQALISANQWMSTSLLNLMRKRGHRDLSSAHLTFFCHLNCGITQASEVARRMGISRQAVYKVTRELQRMGALELREDPDDRRQKIICMTKLGERIALDARATLEEVEAHLKKKIGAQRFHSLREVLRQDWGPQVGARQ